MGHIEDGALWSSSAASHGIIVLSQTDASVSPRLHFRRKYVQQLYEMAPP